MSPRVRKHRHHQQHVGNPRFEQRASSSRQHEVASLSCTYCGEEKDRRRFPFAALKRYDKRVQKDPDRASDIKLICHDCCNGNSASLPPHPPPSTSNRSSRDRLLPPPPTQTDQKASHKRCTVCGVWYPFNREYFLKSALGTGADADARRVCIICRQKDQELDLDNEAVCDLDPITVYETDDDDVDPPADPVIEEDDREARQIARTARHRFSTLVTGRFERKQWSARRARPGITLQDFRRQREDEEMDALVSGTANLSMDTARADIHEHRASNLLGVSASDDLSTALHTLRRLIHPVVKTEHDRDDKDDKKHVIRGDSESKVNEDESDGVQGEAKEEEDEDDEMEIFDMRSMYDGLFPERRRREESTAQTYQQFRSYHDCLAQNAERHRDSPRVSAIRSLANLISREQEPSLRPEMGCCPASSIIAVFYRQQCQTDPPRPATNSTTSTGPSLPKKRMGSPAESASVVSPPPELPASSEAQVAQTTSDAPSPPSSQPTLSIRVKEEPSDTIDFARALKSIETIPSVKKEIGEDDEVDELEGEA